MYLGIDLGTSELKVLLLDEQHRIVASVGEPLTLTRPHPLWSEQNPADWWAAMDSTMQRLRADQPQALAAVRAIGLAGQMHGAVLVGGGARSPLWAQLLASALGVVLRIEAGAEAGGALGAARLAWLADGGAEGDVCRTATLQHAYTPDAAEAALLAPRRERFRALYPALRRHF